MSKLQAWLKPTIDSKTQDITISNRFVDPETNEPVKITIRTITQEANDQLIKRNTIRSKDKGQVYESLDKARYQGALVVACVVEPDLRNAELCQAYGVVDPVQLPAKMFWTGEFAKLVEAIMVLNGFRDPDAMTEELTDEAKNS